MTNSPSTGIAKKNGNLERQFDTATYESGYEGCTKKFNSVVITDHSYPYLNGAMVTVICKNGKNILELVDCSSMRPCYKYAVLTNEQAQLFANVEYDPYNDATYARALLDIYATL